MLSSFDQEIKHTANCDDRLYICNMYMMYLHDIHFIDTFEYNWILTLPYYDEVPLDIAFKAVDDTIESRLLGKIISQLINLFEEGYYREAMLHIILSYVPYHKVASVLGNSPMLGHKLIRLLHARSIYRKYPNIKIYMECCVFERKMLGFIS